MPQASGPVSRSCAGERRDASIYSRARASYSRRTPPHSLPPHRVTTAAPIAEQAPPPAPPRYSGPEISRELVHHFPALHEELRLESAVLRRDVLLWQRWIRYTAALLAFGGAFAMVLLDGALRPWVPLIGVASAYLGFTALVSLFLQHGSASALPPRLPWLVLAADVLAVAAAIYFSASPAHYYRILLLGFLVVQLAAFYFGSRYAIAGTVALVGLYLLGVFVIPPYVAGNRPSSLVAAFNTTFFLFVAGVLVFTFGSFRRRMNQLRAFCKRVELGDLQVSYDAEGDSRPDDLTLLARSVDGMRHRLIDLIGTDPLTGCLNRRAFEMRLGREWRHARRKGTMLAVIAIDCDNFKPINDTFGHAMGDQVLIELAAIMRQTGRETDFIARLGGDEFVILLPDTTWQGATTFAERLRRRVDDHVFCGREQVGVTISVGVAVARGTDEVPPEYLLEEADRSLYKAKTSGRNRISA